jgi:hypothetical protein
LGGGGGLWIAGLLAGNNYEEPGPRGSAADFFVKGLGNLVMGVGGGKHGAKPLGGGNRMAVADEATAPWWQRKKEETALFCRVRRRKT